MNDTVVIHSQTRLCGAAASIRLDWTTEVVRCLQGTTSRDSYVDALAELAFFADDNKTTCFIKCCFSGPHSAEVR